MTSTAAPPRSAASATRGPGPGSPVTDPNAPRSENERAASLRRLGSRQLRDLSVWARQLVVLARSGMPLAAGPGGASTLPMFDQTGSDLAQMEA